MKKMLILLVFIILLCGCTSEVTLTVDENSIDEEISITSYEDNDLTKDMIKKSFRDYMPVYKKDQIPDAVEEDEKEAGITYYNKKILDIGNGYNCKYQYKFKLNDYHNAITINSAFRSFNIAKDNIENTLTLATDGNGLTLLNTYTELDRVKINLKSDLEVVESNGEKDGNNYTWTFTRGEKKNLYIKYKLPEKESEKKDEKKESKTTKMEDNKQENIFIRFINEHPILTTIIALVIFFLGVKIISKIKE